jgi:aldehyde:ferredoxin oxidoreductase
MLNDPINRVLYIDLSRLRSWAEERPQLFSQAMGGAGVGIHLLQEECAVDDEPLSPQTPIIFAVGPLVGHFPLASKTIAIFKSPHTGNYGESHAGGRSAISIRMAGYGALVIRGKSNHPVYIVIEDDNVIFKDASALWGMRSSYTVGSVLRSREFGSGLRSIMRIGRAGERKISYACVITETYRHFGRLGLGAVFGSKNLKALIVSGKRSLPITQRKLYRQVYDQIYRAAVESPLMKKYHDLGTAMNILPLNQIGALPTHNLQAGRFKGAKNISGENLAAEYLGRRVACAHCPVACIHLAALRTPYPDDPYFYKTSMIAYDHEPVFAMGSLLGIDHVPGLLQLIDEAEVQGLDVMSTGGVLAWATEAQHSGLISTKETDGLSFDWGDYETFITATKKIVLQPTQFYTALAKGVEFAASRYGGAEFALSFGGNEMPGYHTGPACHLGYLSGARHSHLDSAGYSIDQQPAKKSEPLTPQAVADYLLKEERWRQVLSSLVVCFFARGIYTPELISEALASIGQTFSPEELTSLGTGILKQKHTFKHQHGFDLKQIRIPQRILDTPSPHGKIEKTFMRQTLELIEKAYQS